MILPDGENTYKSFLGSISSIITVVLLSMYGIFKLFSLVSYSDYNVQVSMKENFYAAEDRFGFEDGYMMAAGLITYDGKDFNIEDPSFA